MPRGQGTHSTAFKDLTGKQFGLWSVLSRGETRYVTRIYWVCECACGTRKQVSGVHLVAGKSTNCGCSKAKGPRSGQFKHGKSDTPEHNAWMRMIDRCSNPNCPEWHNYGGRGIQVCDRWIGSFVAFLEDMGPRPSARHSVDRYPDKNGNYEPGNCRWATPKEQSRNTRRNIFVDLDGENVSLVEACERSGVNYDAAKWRHHAGRDWRGI